MRQNNYVMHRDQPQSDQPQLLATRMEPSRPLSQLPATTETPSTTANSMMESRMPAHARSGANWGGLKLYHTFMDPVYNSGGSTANSASAPAQTADNNDDHYGYYG